MYWIVGMTTGPDVKELDPKERFKASVKHNYDTRHEFLTRGNRCPNCVLVKTFCVCTQLAELAVGIDGYCVVVLMNQREQYRSSNTAKVIERVLGAKIFIDGLEEDWSQFVSLLKEYEQRMFLLFPSEESVEFSNLVLGSGNSTVTNGEVLIVVVDGTWRQARKLNQRIPSSVPRVRITPTTLSKFLCRRQTRVDRVCTAEALSLLLLDMGLEDASKNLDSGLSAVVEGFNMQCYGSALRPANMLKNPPQLLKPGADMLPRHPEALIGESVNSLS